MQHFCADELVVRAQGELTRQRLPSILLWTFEYVAIQPPRVPRAHTVERNECRDGVPVRVRQRRRFLTVRERGPVHAAAGRRFI